MMTVKDEHAGGLGQDVSSITSQEVPKAVFMRFGLLAHTVDDGVANAVVNQADDDSDCHSQNVAAVLEQGELMHVI